MRSIIETPHCMDAQVVEVANGNDSSGPEKITICSVFWLSIPSIAETYCGTNVPVYLAIDDTRQKNHCHDLSGRRAGGSRSKSLLSKAWLYSGEDDCGVREQSAGVRNGSGGMANILTSSRILLSVLLIINIMPGFIVQMKFVVIHTIDGFFCRPAIQWKCCLCRMLR